MFVETLGMLELDLLTLLLSLKWACVEMQRLILADVFILFWAVYLTPQQTESITLPATLGFSMVFNTLIPSACVFVLEKVKKQEKRGRNSERPWTRKCLADVCSNAAAGVSQEIFVGA